PVLMGRSAATTVCLLGVFAAFARAAEGPIPVRPMQLGQRAGFLTLSVPLPELADDALRKKLRRGFASTIVLRAYLYAEGQARPFGATPRTTRIVRDLWDEVYLIQIVDPQGQRSLNLSTEAAALAELSRLDTFPLAPLASLPANVRLFVAIL